MMYMVSELFGLKIAFLRGTRYLHLIVLGIGCKHRQISLTIT